METKTITKKAVKAAFRKKALDQVNNKAIRKKALHQVSKAETVRKRPFDVYTDVRATPLADILAVTVDSPDLFGNYQHPCQIYGRIVVTNKLDHSTFHIYNRRRDDPQSMFYGGSLLLTPPFYAEDAAIVPTGHVIVTVQLYDRSRDDMIVAKGKFTLGRTSKEDWLQDYQTTVVEGENNFSAKVYYAIFPYAVTATVSVLLFTKDDHFNTFTETYPNDQEYGDDEWLLEPKDELDSTNYEDNKCSTTVDLSGIVLASPAINGALTGHPIALFQKEIQDPVCVKSGDFIELSRSVVVVPPYATLRIHATFYDPCSRSLIARGAFEFKSEDDWKSMKDIKGDNGRIRVRVIWRYSQSRLHTHGSLTRICPTTPQISDIGNNDTINRKKLFLKRRSSAALIDKCVFHPHVSLEALSANCILPPRFQYPLVEVFSVVVCRKDFKPFRFYGSIIATDGPRFNIFDRDTSCPQDCPNTGTLAIIKGDRRSFNAITEFAVCLDLKDVDGSIISKGAVCCWSSNPDYYRFANRRVCSVVRGESGFAAVHYTFFPDGVSATVDVKIYGKKLPAMVKGEIYARNGNLEPSISYQEKLFKSILFYAVQDGVPLPTSDSTLPLVKSLVTLSRYSYLVIEADLLVSPVNPIQGDFAQGAVSLKGSVGFTANGDSPMRIGTDDLYIEVYVKFFEAY